MFEKELGPGLRLMDVPIPPVLSVETLGITSVQALSRSLQFKSFYWQDNKISPITSCEEFTLQIPAPWLLYRPGPKTQEPCCFPSAASPFPPLQRCERLLTSHERCLSLKTPFPALGEQEEARARMQSCAAALQLSAGKFGGCFTR